MKAIIIEKFGGPEGLVMTDLPEPEARPGHLVMQIKAFGINHAEMHMRKGEWPEAAPVSGIEGVGLVHSCPGNEFEPGTKVVTLMGGLGRTINGTYAEYTSVPVTNVTKIYSNLPWEKLAAIPETFATAWTCLFRNLELKTGDRLLVRGATSSLGQAALKLAVHAGAEVIVTTRNEGRKAKLREMGARRVEIESSDLSARLQGGLKVDAVLNLVGNSVLLDSMKLLRRGGRMCPAGFLGGLAPIEDFNPLLQMPSDVHFSFFGSFVFGTPEFPLSDVPLQSIVDDVAKGTLDASPSHVFSFQVEKVREAHRVVESNQANGKMVVKV